MSFDAGASRRLPTRRAHCRHAAAENVIANMDERDGDMHRAAFTLMPTW